MTNLMVAADGGIPSNIGSATNNNVKRKQGKEQDSSDDDDAEIVNVDFEWFDPQEIDFQGLKLLLRQLFDVDSELFDLSALSSLIIAQPLLGSTVKVPDDEVETHETDPFAFLTVLNLNSHRDKLEVKAIVQYLLSKCGSQPALAPIANLLASAPEAQVGVILSERFINMPPQIVPPMYKMLLEEIRWAVEEKEPYQFTHYLLLSKTYREILSKIEDGSESGPQKKKSKGSKGAAPPGETFYFHAEDEILQKHALAYGSFEYSKAGAGGGGASDAKRAFQEAGIEPAGHLILIEAEKFEAAVNAVEQFISPTG